MRYRLKVLTPDQVKNDTTTNQVASSGKCTRALGGASLASACQTRQLAHYTQSLDTAIPKTYRKQVQQPDGDPQRPPHRIDDSDQNFTGQEPKHRCHPLPKPTKEGNKRKEQVRRKWSSPPFCKVRSYDEGRSGEACEAKSEGVRDGDLDLDDEFLVLDKGEEVGGRHVVEACAGTGVLHRDTIVQHM